MQARFKAVIFIAVISLSVFFFTSCDKQIAYNGVGGTLPSNYVYITDSTITPNSLRLSIGSSVTFVNTSSQAHQLVSNDNVTINTPTINPSSSYYYKKDTLGVFNYHCAVHPTETGSIEFHF